MITDKNLLESWEIFIRETEASSEDCLIALNKLREGKSVEKVIKKWREKEAELGKLEAEAFLGRKVETEDVQIYTMEDCYADMVNDLKKGKEKGSTTHIPRLDNAWTWKKGEFNIWTGYSNEGKSQFLRFISLIKAIGSGWKFAFYAPEDFPAKEFFDDFIHTASGYSTDKDNQNFIGLPLYEEIYKKLKDSFYFVYMRPPKNNLISILKSFIPLIENEGVSACIIDPIIKVARPKEYMNADDKYAGYVTTLCTDFSRQLNVSLHLVMHQLGGKKLENGLFSKPGMYSIKGGGTWADGTDNILGIWRPKYAVDKEDDEVKFSSDKIKKQKLVGIPQDVDFRFNRKTNRYVDFINQQDVFNFDKELDVPRIKLLFADEE